MELLISEVLNGFRQDVAKNYNIYKKILQLMPYTQEQQDEQINIMLDDLIHDIETLKRYSTKNQKNWKNLRRILK